MGELFCLYFLLSARLLCCTLHRVCTIRQASIGAVKKIKGATDCWNDSIGMMVVNEHGQLS